jgi:hypothetical protein
MMPANFKIKRFTTPTIKHPKNNFFNDFFY